VNAASAIDGNGFTTSVKTQLFFSMERQTMKRPTLRVTKGLADIPVEAHCSLCPTASFKAQGSGHRPNREEYQKSLQTQFDAHCKAAHSEH
jgi:hypothetical protein